MKGRAKDHVVPNNLLKDQQNSPVLSPQHLTKEKSPCLMCKLPGQELERIRSFPHARLDSPRESKHM